MPTRARLSPALAGGVGAVFALCAPAHAQVADAPSDVIYVAKVSATCGGLPVAPVFAAGMTPLGPQDLSTTGVARLAVATELAFSIDSNGRTRDITIVPPHTALGTSANEQNQAILSSWRFPAEAQSDCRVRIAYTPAPVDRAPMQVLAEYYGGNRGPGPLWALVHRRLAGADASCEQLPAFRAAAFPDASAPGQQPGVEDWSVVRWSIDETGRADDVEILASSGSVGFDASVAKATRDTVRVAGQPRSRCVYNWYRRGVVLPAPPMPAPPADPDQRCPATALASWRPMASSGPLDFQKRGIEGWALVRFDITPRGEPEQVELIEAQPAAAFGEAAMAMVRRGRSAPGAGAVGCVQPVEFRIAS